MNDLATATTSGGVSVFRKDANDSLFGPPIPIIPIGVTPDSIGIGDFNGDGSNDVAVGNLSDGSVSLFYATPGGPNPYEGVGAIPIKFTDTAYLTSIAVGDLGNGHADIAVTVSGASNGALMFMSKVEHSGLSFTQTTLPTGLSPSQLAIGHLNSEHGANDIAVGSTFSANLTLFTNTTG